MFYTSVLKRGDSILYRGYESDGTQVKDKIDFQPTFYVGSKKETKWKTLEGRYVDEIKPGSIKDCQEFIKKYEDVKGFDVYGNQDYVAQYICETFQGEVKWQADKIKVYTVDIETTAKAAIDLVNTPEEITLISVKNKQTKNTITFGSRHFDEVIPKHKYVLASDERNLLLHFLDWWQLNMPDIITGWNVDFFDITYIVRRIGIVLGVNYVAKLSPWGVVNLRTVRTKYGEDDTYELLGISTIDYKQLYVKFGLNKLEEYKLDHVCYVELEEGKLENPYDTFEEFYSGTAEVTTEEKSKENEYSKESYRRWQIKQELIRRGIEV